MTVQRRNLLAGVALLAAMALLAFGVYQRFGGVGAPQMDPQYTRIETERVTLMDAFQSYDSIATVTQRLQAAGMHWRSEQSRLPPVQGRPPYDFDTLTVEDTKHLGSNGTLVLDFFNDRLYSASFRPADAKAYLARVRRLGLPLKRTHISEWETVQGNLRIVTNADFAISDEGRHLNTQLYTTWEDMRIKDQIRRWYDTYGQKPLTPG